jgi:hypothetical protein
MTLTVVTNPGYSDGAVWIVVVAIVVLALIVVGLLWRLADRWREC